MVGLVRHVSVAVLLLFMATIFSYAGDSQSDKTPAAPKAGFRAEFLGQLNEVEKKIEDLAGAVPAEKYSWRPGEGVRSVSEVYVHIIGSNYFFMTFLGVKPPMKMDPAMEKNVTDKAEIAKMFKPSFEHVRTTVLNLSDSDLEKTTEMFGSTVTYRDAMTTELCHLHEHLAAWAEADADRLASTEWPATLVLKSERTVRA